MIINTSLKSRRASSNTSEKDSENPTSLEIEASTTNSYIDQKAQKRKQRQIERQIETCEADIEQFEAQINEINEQLTLPDVYSTLKKRMI